MNMHVILPTDEEPQHRATPNVPIPRQTIEDVVRARNEALQLYAEAFDAIEVADGKIKMAAGRARDAYPGLNSYNNPDAAEVKAFHRAVACPARSQYLCVAQRLIDVDVWAWVVERTELERLMDKEAKDKLRAQMRYIPDRTNRDGELITGDEIEAGMPPVTVENIYATIEQFMLDAETIFRRGMANAFSKLDRRFRSHDGFKVGSRLILDRCFNEYGNWNWNSNERDTLMDIERTLTILDGRSVTHNYASTIGAIDHERRGRHGARQSEIETEYFLIRIWKNGNAHLWLKRKDLVLKVNKLLGEYYGEVIPDGMEPEDDGGLHDPKTSLAKNYGFFPTPPDIADRIVRAVPLLQEADKEPLRILEPSAGTGNFARRCVSSINVLDGWSGGREKHQVKYRFDNQVDCVEIQGGLADALRAEGIYRKVYNVDFLQLSPETTGLYDRIVMNPPFDRERDIDHVMHALKFLKPDGYLCAVMSAGTELRETRKSVAFRELMEQMNARFDDLPAGSFSSVGTNVNTIVLRFWNDGSSLRWSDRI